MPICSLNPVRLIDSSVSAGFQLRFFDDQAAMQGISLLPELIHRMEAELSRDYPTIQLCAEVESVCMQERLRIFLRHGLNVRLRFPAYAQASDTKKICDQVQRALLQSLNARNVSCFPIENAADGTVFLMPPSPELSLCVLTKERLTCHPTSGGQIYYSQRLSSALSMDTAAIFDALRKIPGCGFSLQIASAHDFSLCASLVRCAAQLPTSDLAFPELMEIARAGMYYLSQAVVFAPGREACEKVAKALRTVLERSSVACKAWPFPHVDELQRYHLLFDPWALNEWINAQIGGQLAFTASLLTLPELSALSGGIADAAVPALPAEKEPAAISQDDVARYMLSFRLNKEELDGFGVQSESDLSALGLSDEHMGMLRTASCLANMALSTPNIPSLNSYIVPLGTLYESFLRTFFWPTLMDKEEILHERTSDYVRKPGEANLSYFDNLNFHRVQNYAKLAFIDDQKYPFDFWAVMFNCFKCVRLLRNKTSHGSVVQATHEEFGYIYSLLYLRGADHKINALRYAIKHPHTRADDDSNQNLKILHPSRYRTTDDLLNYVSSNQGLFEESLLSFILRCSHAKWNEEI